MSPLDAGRSEMLRSTLQTLAVQHVALAERISRAEEVGDYEEASRLRDIAECCTDSAARYRADLAKITSQLRLT